MEWNLKKRRPNRLEELIEKSLDIQKNVREVDTDRISKRKRIEKSLLLSDDTECHSIFEKIQNCKKFQKERRKKDRTYEGRLNRDLDPFDPFSDDQKYVGRYVNNKNVCQSLWCPNCRKFLSKMYENRVKKRLTQRLLPSEYTNDDFHHISGVLGICEVDEKEVLKLITKDTNRWRRIRYRVNTLIQPKDCPFVETVYEFELVNWRFLRSSSQSDFKRKQIQQLIEHQRFRGSVFLFVHFHSITNMSKEQITEVFRDEYFVGDKPLIKTNKENGLFVQKFHSKQSLEKNIEKLCSYPFKDPHRFKHSFRGSDYLNGEYFEYEELSNLIKVYQKVQKRSWRGLFRSVEHQRSMEFVYYKDVLSPFEDSKSSKWFYSCLRYYLRSFGRTSKERLRKDQIEIDGVWMVDPKGNVYTEGWNPNLFFPNGLQFDIVRKNRKKVGRKYFIHPQYDWLEVYKNVYEETDDTYHTKTVKVEDIVLPIETGVLGKDEYIFRDKKGFYHKHNYFISNSEMKELFKGLKIQNVDRIPLDFDFDITDPNLQQRLENLKRLDENERNMYFNWMVRRERDRKKGDRLFENRMDEFRRSQRPFDDWVKEYLENE